MGSLLAHQGGWDEILLVVGPILVLGGLLKIANRRADRIAEQGEAGSARSPKA